MLLVLSQQTMLQDQSGGGRGGENFFLSASISQNSNILASDDFSSDVHFQKGYTSAEMIDSSLYHIVFHKK